MMGYGAGLGFGLGGLLTMLGWMLLVVGLVVLAVWAFGKVGNSGGASTGNAPRAASSDAIEVLRLRFARGEMTAEEYQAAKLMLEGER
ncbi:MAG: SHOCT domain-containing protein [Candidatus Limnocylindrales bacterium]